MNDILDLSLLESGKFTLESAEFRLSTVFRDLSNLLTLAADEKRITLNLPSFNDDKESTLLGDPIRLAQVLILDCSAFSLSFRSEISTIEASIL